MNADPRVMEFYPSLVVARRVAGALRCLAGAHRRARVRLLAGRGDRRRAVHRHGRAVQSGLRGALPARGRDRLAPRGRALGARLRDGGGAGRARVRLRAAGPRRDRVVHDDRQRPLAPGHGEARHAALARRGFLAPLGRGGASGAAARPVSAAARRVRARRRSGRAPRRLKRSASSADCPTWHFATPGSVPPGRPRLRGAAARRLRARHRPAGQGQRSHAGPADVLGAAPGRAGGHRADPRPAGHHGAQRDPVRARPPASASST